ncbi:MAG: hypothetical protein FWE21_08780 [Defluviitaleaceae bacterium]|nr:hypothetical protein [Defluviitaleaceae bacterium]
MLFKKNKKPKGRVICPIPVIIKILQAAVDGNEGMCEFVIDLEGARHKLGLVSDFNRRQGFFDPIFYLDEHKFDTLEKFKAGAILGGQIFAERSDQVEILDMDNGATKFPWHTFLESYVTP